MYSYHKFIQNFFSYDEEVLKEYFPLPKVLDGIFAVARNLFNVSIIERVDKPDVWHKDVRFFDVYDLDISDTEPAGSFYFDAYARDDYKVSANRNSGWTLLVRNKSDINGNKALTSVIFNLQPPSKDGTPSMLTFKAVQALFKNVSFNISFTYE